MKKWEYLEIRLEAEEMEEKQITLNEFGWKHPELDNLGAQGEVVAAYNYVNSAGTYLLLKRGVEE